MIDAKRRRQTTLALLWKFVVNWDDVEREEEKSVEYFSRTFRSTLLIIGNQFLFSETNIGMPNMIVNSKNSWLTSWSNLRRREVLHYYENLILFFDSSSFKRPPANLSCWSQCCHYSCTAKFAHFTISPLMLCDDADVAVDYVLHMQYVYNVLLKDRRKKQFAICQTATLYYWTRKVVNIQVFPKNQRYR